MGLATCPIFQIHLILNALPNNFQANIIIATSKFRIYNYCIQCPFPDLPRHQSWMCGYDLIGHVVNGALRASQIRHILFNLIFLLENLCVARNIVFQLKYFCLSVSFLSISSIKFAKSFTEENFFASIYEFSGA